MGYVSEDTQEQVRSALWSSVSGKSPSYLVSTFVGFVLLFFDAVLLSPTVAAPFHWHLAKSFMKQQVLQGMHQTSFTNSRRAAEI